MEAQGVSSFGNFSLRHFASDTGLQIAVGEFVYVQLFLPFLFALFDYGPPVGRWFGIVPGQN